MDPDKEKAISDLAAEVRDEPPQSENSPGEPADEAPNDDDGAQPPAQSPNARSSGGGRAMGAIALLLALIACAGSAYLWYRLDVQQRHEREMSEAGLLGELKGVTESTRALEKAQDKLSAEQGQLTALIQEKLEGSVAKLRQQQEELANSVSKIYDSMDRSIDSWALEEVEQLLRMANHSVSLAGDTGMATTGLELADKRLAELGNPEYVSIRRLIADEIIELKSIQQVDVAGLALRLSSMASAVDDLPLVSEPERPVGNDTEPAAATDTTENMWMEAGQALLSDLKGLVRIQNVTETAKPLLTPEQRYFLLANLRLMLSGAQLAALRADSETYKSNIGKAAAWLADYFDTDNTAVQTMMTELGSMADQDLAPARPDISGSIGELQVVKSRMKAE